MRSGEMPKTTVQPFLYFRPFLAQDQTLFRPIFTASAAVSDNIMGSVQHDAMPSGIYVPSNATQFVYKTLLMD